MKEPSLPRSEWDFSSVSGDLKLVCLLYELIRESTTMRQLAASEWKTYRIRTAVGDRRRVPPPRPIVADFFRDKDLAYRRMLAAMGALQVSKKSWIEQSKFQTHLAVMIESWIQTSNPKFRDPPISIHEYDYALHKGELVIVANLPPKLPHEDLGICLTIDYTRPDAELAESFWRVLRIIRNSQGLRAKKPAKLGRRLIEDDPERMLIHIGVMRLAAVASAEAAVKWIADLPGHPNSGNPSQTVTRARKAVGSAMRRYLSLPADESPINCQSRIKQDEP